MDADTPLIHRIDEPLSDVWLKAAGFRWHEVPRSDKHWLLWMGRVAGTSHCCDEDVGVEVAPRAYPAGWFCWLRADYDGRYSRFIHIRHVVTVRDLLNVIFGLTGEEFDHERVFGGVFVSRERAEHRRREDQRLDRRIASERPWNETEKDPSRGLPISEHIRLIEGRDV